MYASSISHNIMTSNTSKFFKNKHLSSNERVTELTLDASLKFILSRSQKSLSLGFFQTTLAQWVQLKENLSSCNK